MLHPGKIVELDMFVDFRQQLAPAKLGVYCNTKCYPVKLVPDIGAFLRPKKLTATDFDNAESKLLGMFETIQRYMVWFYFYVSMYSGSHNQRNLVINFAGAQF